MVLPITETQVPVTVGAATLVGRRWTFPPIMPGSLDTSPEADTFRARNAGKMCSANVWMGIRYALPPVGDLRFADPVDYDYPAGSFDMSVWPNVPYQQISLENDLTGSGDGWADGRPEWGNDAGAYDWARYPGGVTESEDCLFMNGFIPTGTPPVEGWPTLVWFPGGGNVANSANNYRFLGHRLAAEGIAVFVAQSRLSNFGFHYHPDFGAGPNFAYADRKSALRWVQRNGAALGCDPANVTIGGSSAGGQGTLGLLQDDTAQSLLTRAWATSGGGTGPRWKITPNNWYEGYARRYYRFRRALVAAAPYMRDYSDPTRTVDQVIHPEGQEAYALRHALSPAAIMALSDARDRYSPGSIKAGSPALSYRGSQNLYPFVDANLTYSRDTYAARAGKIRKPIVLLCSENEASAIGGAEEWAEIPADGYLQWLGYGSYAEWQKEAFVSGTWSDTERRRIVYNQAVFHYAAWRIARACYETASAPAYLCLWNFFGNDTGYAGHASDVQYLFGNTEWCVPRVGAEANVTMRALNMVEGMRRLFCGWIQNGRVTGDYSYAGGFDLFASPTTISLAPYTTANPGRWNVIGNNGRNANYAPVEVRHEDYFASAWTAYLARDGAVSSD